jgi:hypothetical protein
MKKLSSNEICNFQYNCKNDLIKGRIICIGFKELCVYSEGFGVWVLWMRELGLKIEKLGDF